MYSFEGQYRRIPKQNLAGASTQQKTDELLNKVHRDRMKREEDRRKLQCAILINAAFRSYYVRQRQKENERQEFDKIISNFRDNRGGSRSTTMNEDVLNVLSSKIVFFYNPDKDINRLVTLSQKMLLMPDVIITSCCNKINHWFYKLKKLLLFHLKLLTVGRETLNTHLRIIDLFTSDTTLAKYIQPNEVTQLLLEVFVYLIKHDYFERFRDIVDQRVPPMLEPSSEPPTAFAASLFELIYRPLKLVSLNCDQNYNNLVLQRFVVTFLSKEFSEPVRYFVIPCLSSYSSFPFSSMINATINCPDLREEYQLTSWLLFSVVSLCKEQYFVLEWGKIQHNNIETFKNDNSVLNTVVESSNEEQFSNYLNLLSRLCHNCSKLGVFKMIVSEDSDSESDEDEIKDSSVTKQEIEVLEMATKSLNKYEIVQAMINKCIKYQNSMYGNEIVQSIGKICYHLLTSRKSDLHEYKLLCSLALSSQFLRKLWLIITTKEQRTIFGSAAAYVNMISRGIELQPNDVQEIVPLLTTFCSLLMLLITTLHDNEFYNDDSGAMTKVSPMPFSLKDMAVVSSVLKELCVGLVELAYPDSSPDFKVNVWHNITPRFRNDQAAHSMWPRLFKVAVALLRQLHSRDLRRQFCPDGMWVSTRISMLKMDRPPNFVSSVRRRHLRPFSRLPCYTREDLEEGPPLSTRELRSMTVIREMPFLLPFQERVLVFQNHVLKDKMEHQGEAPYAFRGRSLDVSVRRNYLYEDAFDKLSPANAPDLRHVMRVQLRNAVGVNEAGVDGGGLSREFLSELIRTAFDPNRGFFRLTNDNQLFPNPHVALLHPDFAKHYYFIGRVLGKAMYENLLVELPLAEFFLSKLVSRHSDVSIHHLASLDPVMYKNLLFLKNYEGDVSDLGLDFTVVIDELGETKVQELKPNGAEIPVTNENKIEYIHLIADYKLNKQIGAQNTAFKNGLADVIQLQWLHMFSNKELQILISGAEIPVDVADLKRHAKYSGGYHENHQTIKLFWQVLEDFDDNQRRQLLKFVTSCSRQPLFGFKELDPPFCIQKAGSTDRLPTASTCMNLLKMPEFNDYDVLRDRVLYAIQAGAGFELS